MDDKIKDGALAQKAGGAAQEMLHSEMLYHSAVEELSDWLFLDSRRYDTGIKEGV